MTFLWPIMLLLLVLIPMVIVFYQRSQAQRQQFLAQYGSMGLLQTTSGQALGRRRHVPLILFISALTVLIVALARPQAVVSLPRLEGTLILTFDVSASMAATDLVPSRIEVAKEAARAFVAQQPPTVQLGVVAFSNGGLALQVPTYNREDVLAAIDRLVPQSGTSLGEGMIAALNTIATEAGSVGEGGDLGGSAIVLFSDGENNGQPNPLDVAQAAANSGVEIYTVGIGSPEGATLELDGFTVFTQLDAAVLQQIAEMSNGSYYAATDLDQIDSIYSDIATQLVVKPEETEITALFAAVATLLLIIGGLLSLLWLNRMP
jgi:Ca-activated chloride channel homolog